MPIFEYKCKSCGKTSELLIRSSAEKARCDCGSEEMEKLFSAFAVSERSSASPCSNGSCSLPSSPCASGMCGLN